MDPSFVNYLNVSVRDAYLNHEDFSECLINELVQASLRVNYGQNINVHEFVGKFIDHFIYLDFNFVFTLFMNISVFKQLNFIIIYFKRPQIGD